MVTKVSFNVRKYIIIYPSKVLFSSMAGNTDGFSPAICHTHNLSLLKFDYAAVKTIILPLSQLKRWTIVEVDTELLNFFVSNMVQINELLFPSFSHYLFKDVSYDHKLHFIECENDCFESQIVKNEKLQLLGMVTQKFEFLIFNNLVFKTIIFTCSYVEIMTIAVVLLQVITFFF